MMQEAFSYSIFGNMIYSYLSSIVVFLVGVLLVFIFKKYALSRMKAWAASTETSIDDALVGSIAKAIPVFYVGMFFFQYICLVSRRTLKRDSALS